MCGRLHLIIQTISNTNPTTNPDGQLITCPPFNSQAMYGPRLFQDNQDQHSFS